VIKRVFLTASVVLLSVALSLGAAGKKDTSAKPSQPAQVDPQEAGPATLSQQINGISLQLDTSGVAPRQVEEKTERAILRDYAAAWASLSKALDQNRADLLTTTFVGDAQQLFATQIAQQSASGLRTKYVDHGHKLQAIFYSPEGSAMQLRDIANLEIQLIDGDKVVHSESLAVVYTAVMTTAEDRWKVRVLQAQPTAD